MKKYINTALCCLFCSVLIIVIAINVYANSNKQFTATQVDYKILLNGEEKQFNMPIVNIDGNTYIPLRETSEKFGWQVIWNAEGSEILLSDAENKEKMLDTSVEGMLDSGNKYEFHGEDSCIPNLDEYRETWNFTVETKLDATEVAETPLEAAKIGLRYISPPPKEADTIIVRYCSETDVWVLSVRRANPAPIPGGSSILTINLSDGSMVRYSTPGV